MEILNESSLPPEACRRLLDFYRSYHERNIEFFLGLRRRWQDSHPGESFGGLCANVNPLSGELRPDNEQMLWGWGDGRALSTWSGFLAAKRVPSRLREALAEYVEEIFLGLSSRCTDGRIPFSAHYRSSSAPGTRIDYSTAFAAAGFCRYGLYARSPRALELGLDLLRRCGGAIAEGSFDAPPTHHGPHMILLGAIVDVLDTASGCDLGLPSGTETKLLESAWSAARHVLAHHFRPDPPAFWEHSAPQGPVRDDDGHIVVDPGHATEFAGFLAELARLTGDDRHLEAALAIHLFADRIGFTPAGVMTKFADLETGQVLGDTQATGAGGRPTAPWWNVREHSAAALRLYTLRGDARLLESYRRAQNASYRHYPSERLSGQMIQAVDPWTCEPLDIPPATGNLDPMHDPRARLREIECLELLLRTPRPWQAR
jgi:hypothetical protein